MSELRELFVSPNDSYRPWTYWWWPGNCVEEKTLTAQLDEMIAGGLGGAVIVPCYQIDESRESIPIYSAEYNALVAHTLREAKKRNFLIWLNLGGGRLPGGPFVTEESSAQRLAARQQRLRGPKRIDTDIWLWAAKTHQSRLGQQVAPHLTLDSIHLLHRDERNRVRERVFIDSPPERGVRWIWSLEKGIFDLIVCFHYPTGQRVEHPCPDWDGYVLDPYNADVAREFIEATVGAFGDTGDAYLGSSFMGWHLEGFEAPGANYTPTLFAQFEERRGYDLRYRLPDLWDNLDKDSEGVRQDMLRTLSELQNENFYTPLFEAIQSRGAKLQLQAHGASADIMSLAARADVPMGETAGPRTYEKYIDARGRRFASSAALHKGKRVVSGECYTRLHESRFGVSLELMKAASDTIYLGGINHLCNHGMTYSPPDADPPWIYCEPTLVGPNQSWWKYYPELARYVTRLNALFQTTEPVKDVLMYAPLADSFARTLESIPLKRGLDNTWGQKLTGEPGIDSGAAMGRHTLPCADPIEEGGYLFDYINGPMLLEQAKCVDGHYVIGDHRYRVMVFHRVGYLPLAVLRRLRELITEGCLLIVVGRTPMGFFGKAETEANEGEFNEIIASLYPQGGSKNKSRKVGKGVVHEVETPVDLVALLDKFISPDVVSDPPEPNLGFAHRVDGGKHLYFFTNCSQKNRSLRVGLRMDDGRVERWNAATGETIEWPLTTYEDGRLWARLNFRPYDAFVLTVDPGQEPTARALEYDFDELRIEDGGLVGWTQLNGDRVVELLDGVRTITAEGIPDAQRISGPWQVTFAEPLGETLEFKKLKCWTKSAKTKHFSGIATYQTDFEWKAPDEELQLRLDMGRLHDVAEARINGVSLGVTWKPLRVLPIPAGVLQEGVNTIEIDVCNLGHNAHLLEEHDPRFKQHTGYGQTRAVRGVKEDAPIPSGLLGPVRIRFYKSMPIE